MTSVLLAKNQHIPIFLPDRDEAQEREASLACELLNRMLELGRPQSYLVGSKREGHGGRAESA